MNFRTQMLTLFSSQTAYACVLLFSAYFLSYTSRQLEYGAAAGATGDQPAADTGRACINKNIH